jgi:hypothetical protein
LENSLRLVITRVGRFPQIRSGLFSQTKQHQRLQRRVTLAMLGDKKREQFADKNFAFNLKSKTNESARSENSVHRQTEQERQHVQVKPKQLEPVR